MKAQRLIIREFGDPKNQVSIQEVELPELQQGQILIQITAAPINPADINYIQGNYGVRPELPASIGMEGSGIVVESSVPHLAEGALVFFVERASSWASHVICDASAVIEIPKKVDPLQASMLKVNPMTAWRLLTSFQQLQPGQRIIQNAANSGVGQSVIQVAKQLGIETLNIVRSEKRLKQIEQLGGNYSFLDNADLKSAMTEAIGPDNHPALAFNAVGGDSALRLMDCLGERGDHITYGAMSLRSLKVPNKFLIFKRLCLHGLWVTKDIAAMPRTELEQTYLRLASWIEQGKLTQPIEASYSLEQFAEALEHHQQEDKSGKILFQPKF